MALPSFTPGISFNTQPPEGGWDAVTFWMYCTRAVSTHSRLKAAGTKVSIMFYISEVSTHSRLKAAGQFLSNKSKLRAFQHTAA